MTISGGKFISAGITAAIGKRDKGILIKARESYWLQLKWIANKYILLFDVNDRIAWLVDGASALLHLVRASIKHLQGQEEFGEHCLFDWDRFHEAAQKASGKQAAVSILYNEDNMCQPLFKKPVEEWQEESIDASGASTLITKKKTTFFRFSDKVSQIFSVLEQIVDHQAAAADEDGFRFNLRMYPRRQLEGFEFIDIAEDRDPLYPHLYSLHEFGKGWVDFVRAIRAITLFGNGYGELMEPADTERMCSSWMKVPKNKDYLAVSVPIMEELLRRGDREEVPWRVIDEIYWHTPGKTFEPCQCRKHVSSRTNCDRVQVLLPSGFRKTWGKGFSCPTDLVSEGALIFGHSVKFPLRWGDHGDPSQEDVQREFREPEDDHVSLNGDVIAQIASSLPNRDSVRAGEILSTQHNVRASRVSIFKRPRAVASRKLALLSFKELIRSWRRHDDVDCTRT